MEDDFHRQDMSKPFYDRQPGEVGIYLDPYDAEALDPKAFGSKLFFINDLTERIYYQLKKTGLDIIKGTFERRKMLEGVYFEGFHKGVVLSVSCDDVENLEELWSIYENNQLEDIFKEIFVSTDLLRATKTNSIELRTRMWKDEFESCKREIQRKETKHYTLADKPNDRQMLRKVKEYQNQLANILLTLRDTVVKFDQTLGAFLMTYKRNIPASVDRVTTLDQMEEHLKLFKEKGVDLSPFNNYKHILASVRNILSGMEENIAHPLAQVHAQCETPAQRKLKAKIKETIIEWQTQLKMDSDLSSLRHPELKSKILLREQRLFLSLVSLPVYASDAVKDIDLTFDEYLSGVQVDLRE